MASRSKQGKALRHKETVEESAFLNLQRTADALQNEVFDVLRPANLSGAQFNVLHILNAAGDHGIPSKDIADRMITRDPDLTRLLDKLEARKLVARHRCDKDRRRVYSKITPEGVELLKELDAPVQDKLREVLAHLGVEKLGRLIELLVEARTRVAPSETTCDGTDGSKD